MDKKTNSFLHDLLGRQLPFRERVFRMILIIAFIADSVAILETFVLMGADWFLVPLSIMLVSVILAMVLTVKFHKHRFAERIIDFVLIVLVFPNMFFVNGGVHGGAPVWFIVSMIYTVLMFSGRNLFFSLLLNILVEVSVYAIAFLRPDLVTPLGSAFSETVDSFFSVITVSFAVGAMFKFQTNVYKEERSVVEKQNEELDRLNKSKDRFFTNMSREIITPLNTLMGLNEMVLRENPQGSTNEYARGVEDAGHMLLGLVNDILDVSQLETKKLEIRSEEYSTLMMLQNISKMMKMLLQGKNVEFQLNVDEHVPAVLKGDEKRITQILTNLLMNAIKNTEEGYIALHVDVIKNHLDTVELQFQIEDTGCGIRKEEIDNLFDAFKRGGNDIGNQSQGAGLGLTISKMLAELMNGSILVDSIYTKGSVFTVVIEQEVVDFTSVKQVEHSYQQKQLLPKEYKPRFIASSARLLYLTNNKMDVDVMRTLMQSTKMMIDVVENREECLKRTMKHCYHIIMIDDGMVQIDNAELIHAIQRQKNGLCRESALIAITANMTNETEKRHIDSGFDCVMEKPFAGNILEEDIVGFLPDDIVEFQSYEVLKDDGMPRRKEKKRRKKRVVVTTDCVAEIPNDILETYEIQMMYLYIRTPHGRFADKKEIDVDSLAQYLTDDSSQAYADSVSIEEYEEFFIRQLDFAEQVVHISMASNVGKSFQVASDAAKGLGHVTVVDSSHISCGQSILVCYAAQLAQFGAGVEEICNEMERISKQVETGFIIPSANVFYRNGYTSQTVANVSRMFRLRPILSMRRSKVEVTMFGFGSMDFARKKYIQTRLRRKKNINTDVCFISHVGLTEKQLQELQDEIHKHVQFERYIIQKASFSCACNAGMGTFGFAFYRNKT